MIDWSEDLMKSRELRSIAEENNVIIGVDTARGEDKTSRRMVVIGGCRGYIDEPVQGSAFNLDALQDSIQRIRETASRAYVKMPNGFTQEQIEEWFENKESIVFDTLPEIEVRVSPEAEEKMAELERMINKMRLEDAKSKRLYRAQFSEMMPDKIYIHEDRLDAMMYARHGLGILGEPVGIIIEGLESRVFSECGVPRALIDETLVEEEEWSPQNRRERRQGKSKETKFFSGDVCPRNTNKTVKRKSHRR